MVMAIARELQTAAQAGGRYRVLLTRASDSYVPCASAWRAPRRPRPTCSCRSTPIPIPIPSVRGASVYTLSEEASDREAAALAARENRADGVVSGMRLGQPDGQCRAHPGRHEPARHGERFPRLAETIVRTFGQNGVRLLPRTHRQAGFAVLTSPDIPGRPGRARLPLEIRRTRSF